MASAPVSVMLNRPIWSHALSNVWSQSSTKSVFLFTTVLPKTSLWDRGAQPGGLIKKIKG